jgi:Tfp pilus assembly protein PilV
MKARIARRQSGVSIVEALVALGIMAFGMLGMAGIQTTLRTNSDIARQRGEAVRIAQETIERVRAYTIVPSVGTPLANRVYFDDIDDVGSTAVVGYTTNTTFNRVVNVQTVAGQSYKSFVVDVTWTDRSNTTQQVTLATVLHRAPPELSAALAIPGGNTATQSPGQAGRHPSVPPGAVDQGDGTSHYTPPAGTGVAYLGFANDTGLITKLCDITTGTAICTDVTGRLLAGFVVFATDPTTPPGPAEAELPSSTAFAVSVGMTQSFPAAGVPAPQCFTELIPSLRAVAYACLVHVLSPNYAWSGQSFIGGLTLATSAADSNASAYRVCRYTTYRSNVAVGSTDASIDPATGQRRIPVDETLQNFDHPLAYSLADRTLLNHNFLVIKAGDGALAFTCPADNPSSTFVDSDTYDHQPSS